jgi:hypothetical protein
VYSGRLAILWKARLLLNSLKSVVDTSRFSVDALNDEKMKDGKKKFKKYIILCVNSFDYNLNGDI